MSRPYRVAVWGPSNLGSACIREILRLPDFELAGVFAYSQEKNGQDIGTLIGLPPTGVKVTTDRETLFAMDADCVLYTARPPMDQEAMDRDIIRILESGKNVVSGASYWYPPLHGQQYVDRIEAACRKGNSSLHGTGENPGFFMERLAVTACGITNTVERLKLTESVYVGRVPGATMPQYGIGLKPEDAVNMPMNELFKRWAFVETVSFTCVALFGRKPDRIEHKPIYVPAEEDIVTETMTIRKGTTRLVRNFFHAILDDKIRITNELVWFVLPADSPFPDQGCRGDKWKIEIEGRPASVSLTVDVMASFDRDQEMYDGDPTPPCYYVTVSPVLQAVPVVCAAAPGIVYASAFTNAVEDFHRLGTRKSMVT